MAIMTITTTSANAARVVASFGTLLGTVDGNGDPRDATATEVKTAVIKYMKGVVKSVEEVGDIQAVRNSYSPIDPT